MFTMMDYQSQASELKPMDAFKGGNEFYNLKKGLARVKNRHNV